MNLLKKLRPWALQAHMAQTSPTTNELKLVAEIASLKQQLVIAEAGIAQAVQEAQLSPFIYSDREVGDDDELRLGDRINCNRQDHNGIDVQSFSGRIIMHHSCNFPVVGTDDGDYASLQDLYMDGYDFTRLATLSTQPQEEDVK